MLYRSDPCMDEDANNYALSVLKQYADHYMLDLFAYNVYLERHANEDVVAVLYKKDDNSQKPVLVLRHGCTYYAPDGKVYTDSIITSVGMNLK